MANIVIEAGLRADIMRKQMETKNQLTQAGDLYIGTGISADGVYQTDTLHRGNNKQVLSVLSNTVGYNNISSLLTSSDVLGVLGTSSITISVPTTTGRLITSGDIAASNITVSAATKAGNIVTTGNFSWDGSTLNIITQ